MITIRNTMDNNMLFNREVIVSEKKVNIIAKKNEPMPTIKIYLPVTVDLLLPKKIHLMRWLVCSCTGHIIIKFNYDK